MCVFLSCAEKEGVALPPFLLLLYISILLDSPEDFGLVLQVDDTIVSMNLKKLRVDKAPTCARLKRGNGGSLVRAPFPAFPPTRSASAPHHSLCA